jgi:hypothetical protein
MGLLKFKFLFTRITSWLPSPIPRGFLCRSSNRFPVNQGHQITPSNPHNHRARKGRDSGAQPMNSQPLRNPKQTTNRQTILPTPKRTMLAPLRQSRSLSHRNHPRPNGSQTCNGFSCQNALRRPCFGFQRAFIHHCTHCIYVLLPFQG